jgi:Fic family protein
MTEVARCPVHRGTLPQGDRYRNGRHARLATDLLLVKTGQPRFSWGQVNLVDPSETRQTYVAVLRASDQHDIGAA